MNVSDIKVALVTGSARRIGATTVEVLHQSGFNVIVHYRNSSEEALELVERLNSVRVNSAAALQGDLLDRKVPEQLATEAVGLWGRLDVLVNNASSFYATKVGSITEQDWDSLVGSNLKAPLFLSQALAEELQRNKGCIINMVDIHADRPLKGFPVYSLAKAGLVALTRSLATELGPDVRVNAIAPGVILWPEAPQDANAHLEIINQTALQRQGDPMDIARTIRFLVTDAPYITGQVIAVDGGRTLTN